MAEIKRYTSPALNKLRDITRPGKDVSDEEIKKQCLEFLHKIKEGREAFIEHLKSIIGSDEKFIQGEKEVKLSHRLTENEYLQPPSKTKLEIWEKLKEISPLDASNPGVWLYLNIGALQDQIIQPLYLVARGNGSSKDSSSLSNLSKMLAEPDEKYNNNPEYLNYTRLALRRLFGAIRERSLKSAIYNDIPLGRIYWQCHLAQTISTDKSVEDILQFFDQNIGIYREFFEKASANLTVISDTNIRDAIIWFAMDKKIRGEGIFRELIKIIGVMTVNRSLGSLSVKENIEILDDIYNDIQSEISNRQKQ